MFVLAVALLGVVPAATAADSSETTMTAVVVSGDATPTDAPSSDTGSSDAAVTPAPAPRQTRVYSARGRYIDWD